MFIQVPFDEDDPRVRAMHEAHHRAIAENEDFSNRVWTLLTEMSPEDLFTVNQLVRSYMNYENPLAAINYTVGQVDTILKVKHNLCGGCGKNHEAEFLADAARVAELKNKPPVLIDADALRVEYIGRQESAPYFTDVVLTDTTTTLPADLQKKIDEQNKAIHDAEVNAEDDRIRESMQRQRNLSTYRVAEMDDGRVKCTDCGVIYPSLEDRMVKPADHCHGCFTKARHG